MVEQRAMASTSFGGKSLLLVREDSSNFRPYPQLDGKYEDVVSDPKLFMNTLEKLHVSMGTKFMYVKPLICSFSFCSFQIIDIIGSSCLWCCLCHTFDCDIIQ